MSTTNASRPIHYKSSVKKVCDKCNLQMKSLMRSDEEDYFEGWHYIHPMYPVIERPAMLRFAEWAEYPAHSLKLKTSTTSPPSPLSTRRGGVPFQG
jgi:hypothetical protein